MHPLQSVSSFRLSKFHPLDSCPTQCIPTASYRRTPMASVRVTLSSNNVASRLNERIVLREEIAHTIANSDPPVSPRNIDFRRTMGPPPVSVEMKKSVHQEIEHCPTVRLNSSTLKHVWMSVDRLFDRYIWRIQCHHPATSPSFIPRWLHLCQGHPLAITVGREGVSSLPTRHMPYKTKTDL